MKAGGFGFDTLDTLTKHFPLKVKTTQKFSQERGDSNLKKNLKFYAIFQSE